MDFVMNKFNEHLDNHRRLDQNMNDLKRNLEYLNALKEDTESKLKAELQPRKKPKKQVHVWLQNVKRINDEVQNLEHQIAESSSLSRGFHTTNVLRKIQEVKDVLQQGQFDQAVVVDDLTWIGQALSTTKLVGNAAKNCMEEIWTCLMNEDIGKIGVWGMGGLGKTTVIKIINNHLLKETQKFNIVIWVTVSKEMNIFKIQERISDAIGVALPEDEPLRAGKLFEMLTRKGKYVLILDDLWSKLSLEEVGIPEPSMGSKLVVTTRKLDVCSYLGCQEVRMATLPEEDAWSLFLEKVGRDVSEFEDLLPIVKSVVEQCAGLPLAIVTVASGMKGIRNVREWRNALNELTRCVEGLTELDQKVLQQLQFSYDHLEGERLQHCFLCCALYPEDWDILDRSLIELWIAEGLVEEMDSEQAKFDQGYAILNKLKSNCLLENGEETECVKVHDLVRDMALRITRVRPSFLVRAGMRLKEIPHVGEWREDLEKVSLMWNHGLKIPLQMSPTCQRLTTLLMSRCSILNIPDCFFEQMKGLKVLDLSWNNIKELPSSISNLEALTALLLEGCRSLEKVPSLSKLEALKMLGLRWTSINNLPHGTKRLVNLNYLEVDVKEVHSGILSKFPCMQHLVVSKAYVKGKEIGELKKLDVFEGIFYNLNEWNTFVQALCARRKWLSGYNICVGGKDQLYEDYTEEKVIELAGCEISGNKVEFPSDVEGLGISSIIVEFPEEAALFCWFIPTPTGMFSSLKRIDICDCKKTKRLFSCSWVLRNLQILEELSVWRCEQLEEIFEEGRTGGSNSDTIQFTLPKLKKLALCYLPELKNICSVNSVMICDSLEKIIIRHCPKLERMPLYLPLLDDGQFKGIVITEERWTSLEWDHPNAKPLLEPFLFFETNNCCYLEW